MIKATLLFLCFSVLSLLALAQDASETAGASSPSQTPNIGYNGGDNNPVDPSTAGAEGSDKSAFNLSKGGLIAIIIVVVFVVVGGIASAVLFWLAKKRQWDVRQSLRRASRRLTGRSDVASKRQNRRTGVRLDSSPPPKNRERDVEKGLPTNSQKGKTTTTITSTFDVDTPTPKPKGFRPSFLAVKK